MVNELEKLLSKAESECKKSGVRLTDKRKNVLSVLYHHQTPMSAYDVIERYRETYGSTLQAMSMYRMLNLLVEVGLVHKLETTNQYLICSHIICDHVHAMPQFLICDTCHSVEEIGVASDVLDRLRASADDSGFVISNQQLEIHGRCASCSE